MLLYSNKWVLVKLCHRLCALCCTQHRAHTGKYCLLSPLVIQLRFGPTLASIGMYPQERSLAGFSFSMHLDIQANAGRKLHFKCNSLFTHDSCVMSIFPQSPRACQDNSQQLLPSKMDWYRLFQLTWNEPSIRWNKVLARSHQQKQGNNQRDNFQLHSFSWWLFAISPLQRPYLVSPTTIPLSTAP